MADEDLVSWMQSVDTQRWEFRELHEATTARFEAKLGEARLEIQRLDARIGEATAQLRGEIQQVRSESRLDLSEMRTELRVGLADLKTTIEQRHASLMKWSFVFWIGSFVAVSGAIAALDQFLHH